MNILVLLKRTFDTEEKIIIKDGMIVEDGVKFIINPYDEYAVEEGIRLRETFGGEVTVICAGPPEAVQEIQTALAMGADKAILIETDALEHADEYTISRLIAKVIQERQFDMILGGNVSVDNGAGQVAPRIAELLDIPQVTTVTKITVEGGKAIIERDVEGDVEMIETTLPALFTAQQGLNEPRYPSLPGIMKAKKKPIERISISDIGISIEEIQSKTIVLGFFQSPKKKAGRILEGELKDQAKELVDQLRMEAKVI